MAMAFETDQHQEMFIVFLTTWENSYCYYWLKHYLLLFIIVISVVKWLFHSSIYYLLLFLIAVTFPCSTWRSGRVNLSGAATRGCGGSVPDPWRGKRLANHVDIPFISYNW